VRVIDNRLLDIKDQHSMMMIGVMTVLGLLVTPSFGSNVRAASKPNAQAKITIENFKHQSVGNPSSLNYNLFTDERGEEKNIYSWIAKKDKTTKKETLQLRNFGRNVLTFVRDHVNSPERVQQVDVRRDLLKNTALDTSADDQTTNEGSIGKFSDRSFHDVKAAAELHDIQQAPYVDEDAYGVILAKEIHAKRNIHVNGGRFLILNSSDVEIDHVRQWKLIVEEHFDDHSHGGLPEAIGWSAYSKYHSTEDNKRGHCGPSITPRTNFFLGPYKSAEVTKTFQLPNDHTRLKLTANFHFLDKWNDHLAYLKINGKAVWQKSHSMCGSLSIIPDFDPGCHTKGINACGGNGVDRMGERIIHQMEYFSNKIELTWGATLEPTSAEEGDDSPSWGVDDLEISVL
jgi:hypothetical protein